MYLTIFEKVLKMSSFFVKILKMSFKKTRKGGKCHSVKEKAAARNIAPGRLTDGRWGDHARKGLIEEMCHRPAPEKTGEMSGWRRLLHDSLKICRQHDRKRI